MHQQQLPESFRFNRAVALGPDGVEFLLNVVARCFRALFVNNQKHHVLTKQLATHANVDGGLLAIARQHPHLDTGLLERVDGLRDTVLKTILNSCSSEKVKVVLNDLGRLVQLVCTVTANGGAGLFKYLEPFLELLLGNFTHRKAERSETLGGVLFQMTQGRFNVRVLVVQALKDDGIGTLAVDADLSIRASVDSRHTLPGGVEFANGQELVLELASSCLDEYGPRLAISEDVSELGGALDKGAFIGRSSLVLDLAALLIASLGDDGVAGS
ncbi:hypothetical protein ColTof3_00437 [Colletotrichum tofieldiae]|nr:hypothetical protein ColTof3_00437 [Colletotrichum tofieldiae]